VTHPRFRELLLLGGVAAVFAVGSLQVGGTAGIGLLAFIVVFGALHVAVRVLAPLADPILLPVAGLLVTMGLLQLASIDLAYNNVGAQWRSLAPLQAAWLAAGAAGFVATLYVFRAGLGAAWRIRYTLALLGIAALLAPLLPGIGHTVNGARLWLRLGPLSFQPGEAAKVLLVLFLAAYLSERRELLGLGTRRIGPLLFPDPRYVVPIIGLVGVAVLIFVRENDFGSSLLFFMTFMAILWVATGRLFYPVTGIGLFAVAVWFALRTFPHVTVRFDAWLHPYSDPQRSGFQVLQGQYALAEGGLSGMGLAGPDTQPNLIPVGWADFILVTIGHTLGLAGLLVVLMAFIVYLTRTFYIALRSRSDLHALAVTGFAIVTGVQAGVIAAGVTRVLPLTGVTLPFVSYGGSSLLANFVILGCVMAVSNTERTTARPVHERTGVAA